MLPRRADAGAFFKQKQAMFSMAAGCKVRILRFPSADLPWPDAVDLLPP